MGGYFIFYIENLIKFRVLEKGSPGVHYCNLNHLHHLDHINGQIYCEFLSENVPFIEL